MNNLIEFIYIHSRAYLFIFKHVYLHHLNPSMFLFIYTTNICKDFLTTKIKEKKKNNIWDDDNNNNKKDDADGVDEKCLRFLLYPFNA